MGYASRNNPTAVDAKTGLVKPLARSKTAAQLRQAKKDDERRQALEFERRMERTGDDDGDSE